MPLHRDTAHRVSQLLRHASAVAALDPGIEQLRGHLAEFERTAGQQHRVIDMLAAAVASGDTDQPLLTAAALAELNATPQAAAEIVTQVRQRLHRIIRERAAATGAGMYRQAAELFDKAAVKFADTHSAVDVEAPAEVAVDMPDRQRKLWRDAPSLAAELDRLAPSLHACAVLAGLAADDPNGEIAVCVDASDIAADVIAAAWMTPETERKAARTATNAGPFSGRPAPTITRCGRWSALLAAGATIRARSAELVS